MALPIVSKNRIRFHLASRASNIVAEPPLPRQFYRVDVPALDPIFVNTSSARDPGPAMRKGLILVKNEQATRHGGCLQWKKRRAKESINRALIAAAEGPSAPKRHR